MCGITGIFNFQNAVQLEQIKRMTDAIAHRGPDGEGFWKSADERLGLGHRRLSIIDLSTKGSQPMHYKERYTLTFNGEIYNYIELREELKNKGYSFYSDSDTEVLLAAYHEFREDCLAHFDGMFAFALWDNVTETLFCARDRFGEKPFFYCYDKNHSFRFASEMKSLWAEGEPKTVNRKMLFYYLAYNVIENPYDKSETFYQNIYRLEAAHYLLIKKDGALTKKRYWNINLDKKSDLSIEKASDKFRELFFQSVARRLRSDVPVGSSLSGGIDSSAVVCAIGQIRKDSIHPQSTFSARFNDPFLDEGKYMNEVAAITPIQRYEVIVDERILLKDLDKILAHQEEPIADASPLAQWCVMRLAKENKVTVLLDGQGADEVLGGYLHFFNPYFKELYLNNKNFETELAAYKKLRGKDFPATRRFKLEAGYPSLFRALGSIRRKFSTPDYLSFIHPDLVNEFKNEPPPFDTFNSLNDSLNYFTTVYGLEKLLRYADRNSMAFSREVRLPFLSHELVEFVFSLPTSYKIRDAWTKYILRASMEAYLPKSITWRVDKLGYQPPVNDWLAHTETKSRIQSATEKLTSQHILRKDATINNKNWALLITSSLF